MPIMTSVGVRSTTVINEERILIEPNGQNLRRPRPHRPRDSQKQQTTSQLVLDRTACADTLVRMSKSPTTSVEIDTDLLEELRAEDPGKPDRELIEDLAKLKVDFGTIRRLQERFDLAEDEAMAVGAEAARAARHSR